jgi:two-component system, OmpR family, manganese sensing sensor histidine kinase
MMFQAIQYRLLVSYMGVLTLILSMFAIAVRITFAQTLSQEMTEELTALAQGAKASIESVNGQLQADGDFSVQDLNAHKQAVQWFDRQGRPLEQQGQYILPLPLAMQQSVQIQDQIQAVTLPVIDLDNGQLVGYVRASESLQQLENTLRRLDWGLSGGVLVALILSGVGGVWLTRQSMQPIEDSFQRLQQFTADASHELRSPLMAIKSNVAVALKYPEGLRNTDAEKFQAIASATSQMTRLTEDLLMLARTDRERHQDWQPVNLTAILWHLIQLYTPEATAKQIQIKFDLPESLYLAGDTTQLTQLFTNLLMNALQYSPAQGIVEIQARQKGTHLQVKVQDTGIGIAPEHLSQVFDRFWRANSSRSYSSGGSGLGLAIAQSVARRHRGSITVHSKVGEGSCFTVLLPAKAFTTPIQI